jgi:8-oxo-dGTP pyrophosphatase MutT (NUDIX family)
MSTTVDDRNNKCWKVLQSDYLIRNKWLTVRKDYVKLSNGFIVDDYYVLEYPDWVTVIAITEDGKYVMERQYRHGIQKTCYELCGGTVEKGEEVIETARRELKEETGYEGGEWEFFSTTAPNPAAMTNLCYTFVARGVFKSGEQSLEKTEDIDVCEMTEQELLEVMKSGQITQGDMLSPLWQWMYNLEVERKK